MTTIIETVIDGTEPVTLDEAQTWLRLDLDGSPPSHPDDDLIEDILIPAAREECERYTGASIAGYVIELKLAEFPDEIELYRAPVESVDSIQYYDADGVLQTLAASAYTFNEDPLAPAITVAYGSVWPTSRGEPGDVIITYTAGFGAVSASPDAHETRKLVKLAVLKVLAEFYKHRSEDTEKRSTPVPISAYKMLQRIKVRLGFA